MADLAKLVDELSSLTVLEAGWLKVCRWSSSRTGGF